MDLADVSSTALPIVFSLAIAVWIVRILILQIGQDGHGHRPLPRSHIAEEETRAQQLHRLS
jgi:hypothetical protein